MRLPGGGSNGRRVPPVDLRHLPHQGFHPFMSELDPSQKRNAARLIAAQSCTKLGDVLTNPKTVLTWMLSQLGTSGALISMLVPVRESGSMLPQLFVSGWVKRVALRKRVFAAGAFAQALAVASMGACALWLPPAAAGIGVLVALALFAVARSFGSISSKDVLGKTVPKGFRGRVGGISNSVSGVIAAVAAIGLLLSRGNSETAELARIVLGASLLWLIGGTLFLRVTEPGSENGGGDDGLGEDLVARLRMVRDDRRFRSFVAARTLLAGSALASPLLVVLSQRQGAGFASLVGFVVAAGIANGSSSFLWGRLADRSASATMASGGFVAAAVGFSALGIARTLPGLAGHPATWPLLFLLFNAGYAGVRLGRKTWVVDAVEGDLRTDYVSASNTLVAVAILLLGGLASPLQAWSPLAALGFHVALCAAGAILALRIKN